MDIFFKSFLGVWWERHTLLFFILWVGQAFCKGPVWSCDIQEICILPLPPVSGRSNLQISWGAGVRAMSVVFIQKKLQLYCLLHIDSGWVQIVSGTNYVIKGCSPTFREERNTNGLVNHQWQRGYFNQSFYVMEPPKNLLNHGTWTSSGLADPDVVVCVPAEACRLPGCFSHSCPVSLSHEAIPALYPL